MATFDINELHAWIKACKQVDALHHVMIQVAARMRELGRTVTVPPIPPPPNPNKQSHRQVMHPGRKASDNAALAAILPQPIPVDLPPGPEAMPSVDAIAAALQAAIESGQPAPPNAVVPSGEARMVESLTTPGVFYRVTDTTCTCKRFQMTGQACKHMADPGMPAADTATISEA